MELLFGARRFWGTKRSGRSTTRAGGTGWRRTRPSATSTSRACSARSSAVASSTTSSAMCARFLLCSQCDARRCFDARRRVAVAFSSFGVDIPLSRLFHVFSSLDTCAWPLSRSRTRAHSRCSD
eukprot:3443698-Rhodomonas_salina.3